MPRALEEGADVVGGIPWIKLTEATRKRGLQGRVTAQHARAMALYPKPYRRRLFQLLLKAGIGVVSDPNTGPVHADIDGLRGMGIPVGLGQDDICDAYDPFGRNNMLEVAFLAAHVLWKTSPDQLESLCDMITGEAARVLGRNHTVSEGAPAHLLVHSGGTVREVLTEHGTPRYVVYNGAVVAKEGVLL